VITIEHVSVERDRRPVLAGIDLAVAPGQVHVVVGPNGGGKSTLVAAVLGMVPFSGSIRIELARGGRVAWVPQSFAADRTLPITVDEFLALSRQRRPACLGIAASARARIDGILERVGLTGMGRRRMGELSGGELRRALIGNAIEPAPEVLLCDEPATGLDPAAVQQLDETLLALCRDHGTAVLLISHDRAQIERVATEVTVLDVRVQARGPAPEALAALAAAAWRRPGGAT
jgi:zinc transport system ATP-binding protein